MVDNTSQAVISTKGFCPTCGVEREFEENTVRWNVVNADANESAVYITMYECQQCGTVLQTKGITIEKNGKHNGREEEV